MKKLEYLETKSGENPDAAVVWLHGLGANGYDFQPIVQQLDLPTELAVHFLFPHAPIQAVTLNQGMEMNAWYDIRELSLHAQEDEQGIFDSMYLLEELITSELRHIDPTRVLMAGFSQGGALTLHTMLHSKLRFGGAIALSTYLPMRKLATQVSPERFIQNEIFMAHGSQDEVLPHEIGLLSKDVLVKLGAHVEWHEYPMGHQLCDAQINDIRAWMLSRLACE